MEMVRNRSQGRSVLDIDGQIIVGFDQKKIDELVVSKSCFYRRGTIVPPFLLTVIPSGAERSVVIQGCHCGPAEAEVVVIFLLQFK